MTEIANQNLDIANENTEATPPIEETPVQEPDVCPIDTQKQANIIAANASANFHLNNIFKAKIDATYGLIANTVAHIIKAAERTENWTVEEIKEIWDRVESEIQQPIV